MTSALKNYAADLTTAAGLNHQRKIGTRGTMLFVREVLPAGNPITVRLRQIAVGAKDGSTISIPMRQNDKIITPVEYDRIELENESGVDLSVDIIFGDGDYVRPLPDLVNVAVSQAGANDQVMHADNTNIDTLVAVKLLDANPDRVRAVVNSLVANTSTLRFGDSTVTAARGTPVYPTGEFLFQCTDELWVIAETVDNQSVSIREEVRV